MTNGRHSKAPIRGPVAGRKGTAAHIEAQKHWLVRARTIRTLSTAAVAVLVLLTVSDLVVDAHADFGIDGSFGFYTWYGFLTCAAMVVFAKLLGFLIKRPDTYYEDGDDD